MSRVTAEMEEEVSERDLFAPQGQELLPEILPGGAATAQRPVPRRPWRRRLRQVGDRQFAALQAAVALESDRGAFALVAPVALGTGALTYFWAKAEPAWPHLLLGLAALCAIIRLAGDRRLLRLAAVMSLLIVAGATTAKVETWRTGTRLLGSDISTRLTGRVVDIDHLSNGRVRLVLDVLFTERPALHYQPQRVRVSTARLPEGVVAGSVVTGLAQLHPPSGPIRPGGYDFAFESYFAGVGAAGFFMGKPDVVTAAAPPPLSVRATATADNIRNAIAERIRATIGGPEGEIAAALMVGVRAGIPEDVNESLRRTGLAHILSISGLHMALVAASVMVVLRLGMALFPGFAATHPTKKYAAGAALVVLSAYLFVSGFEVAAVRSFVMLAVMLIAVLFDRQALTMRNLAIAATLVLLVTPHEVVGPSFQMSFAATAALVAGYSGWTSRRQSGGSSHVGRPIWLRAGSWASAGIGGIAATAVIAGVATSIYGVWHFQRISPFTLFANLAVTPIVSFIIMPFGLLAAAAMPFGLDGPFLHIMGQGIAAMLSVTNYLSLRSPIDAVGAVPGLAVGLITIALLISTLTTTRLRFVALPFLGFGLMSGIGRTYPDIFITEDARLVGVRTADGALLINRDRPNRFTIEGWQRAIAATILVKPAIIDDAKLDRKIDSKDKNQIKDMSQSNELASDLQSRLSYDDAQDMVAGAVEDAFTCKGPLCTVRLPDFGVIAVAANAWTTQQVCRSAALVVVQSPRSRFLCKTGSANLISAKLLSRYGAATVTFNRYASASSLNAGSASAEAPPFSVEYSISEPYRPWHDHRQFSREARGLEAHVRSQSQRPTQADLNPVTSDQTQ